MENRLATGGIWEEQLSSILKVKKKKKALGTQLDPENTCIILLTQLLWFRFLFGQ